MRSSVSLVSSLYSGLISSTLSLFLFPLVSSFSSETLTCWIPTQVGVEHYFSTAKARRLLGYRALTPPHTAMQRVVAWHRKQGDARADQPWFHLSQPLMRAILLCVAVLGVGLLLGRAAWAHIAAL